MPTVFLLDSSLSMCRRALMPDSPEPYQLKNLAVHGINTLLDHMNSNCKLEFCSLVETYQNVARRLAVWADHQSRIGKPMCSLQVEHVLYCFAVASPVEDIPFLNYVSYSSKWELVVRFTRDFESLKTALLKLESGDKTCLIPALEGLRNYVLEEWGAGMPCQFIIVTDGNLGLGQSSLRSVLSNYPHGQGINGPPLALPYPFPCKIHVMCLANPSDSSFLQQCLPSYQKLIDLNGGGGQIFLPEGSPNLKTVQQMFLKLADISYKSFRCVLRCGKLFSHVTLSPPPESYSKTHDFESMKVELSGNINICGFVDINDVASPPSLSRHLVLPIMPPKESLLDDLKEDVREGELELEESGSGGTTSGEDGKQPSFCVLLHGSLKVESMVALCHFGGDWYGMLYSWADSKKKSNLMLSTFEPGLECIPWLGSFKNFGSSSLLPKCEGTPEVSFPIKPAEKHSYSQNSVVWIRQSGLQADIQKILRHARKLPEKTQHFYKELNRLRRAALSFGFLDLLEGMATILERECTLLPGTAHPDAALQLTHAATVLRTPTCKDYNTSILPLRTKFSSGD